MRSFLLAAVAASGLALPTAQAQDCSGNVTLSTQAEVDAFDCSTVSGTLRVQGAGITDLDGLSELTSVGGTFNVTSNDDLTSVAGLSSLTNVGGTFALFDNESLPNADGLESLTTVGGGLEVLFNDVLTDVDGLSSLQSVGGGVRINTNASLENLNGLAALESFSSTLQIVSNGSLTDITGLGATSADIDFLNVSGNGVLMSLDGIEGISAADRVTVQSNAMLQNLDGLVGLSEVPGDLSIGFNAQLQSTDGLANVTSVGGNLSIQFASSLENLSGFASLQSVGGTVTIASNGSLLNVDGLANLASIGGTFALRQNGALADVDGLQSLGSIGGAFDFRFNDAVPNLDGLASLMQVDGFLRVSDNDGLTNVDGLANLTRVGSEDQDGLIVTNNGTLARCAVGLGPILVLERDGDGSAIVGSNTFFGNDPAGDCNSEQDIIDAFEAIPGPIEGDLAGSLGYGTCPEPPATLAAGRESCRVQATGTLSADRGQRYTVFLRVAETGRIAFRGEVKPQPDQSVEQSIKFVTRSSDPQSFTLELVAEEGSVGAPGEGAVVLGSLALEKAGAGLRAAEPLSAYPNPAATHATLRFALAEAGEATLVVYDALGREVARPLDGPVEGVTEARLDAHGLPAGLYVARLTADGRTETARFSVVR